MFFYLFFRGRIGTYQPRFKLTVRFQQKNSDLPLEKPLQMAEYAQSKCSMQSGKEGNQEMKIHAY